MEINDAISILIESNYNIFNSPIFNVITIILCLVCIVDNLLKTKMAEFVKDKIKKFKKPSKANKEDLNKKRKVKLRQKRRKEIRKKIKDNRNKRRNRRC